jgi:hypothetical protein
MPGTQVVNDNSTGPEEGLQDVSWDAEVLPPLEQPARDSAETMAKAAVAFP